MNKEDKNTLAYELHRRLLDTIESFVSECQQGADISVVFGASNLLLSALAINAPNRQEALNTLADCYEIQKQFVAATPNMFFGRGLEQNAELN